MDAGSLVREAWEIVPILLLLVVGVTIAVQSGVQHVTSRRDLRQVVRNLSQIFLRMLAYGAAMLLVNEWIGMRPGLGW
jgi:hypothetical protein